LLWRWRARTLAASRIAEEGQGMAALRGSVGAARPTCTQEQRISAADAAALVRSGDWVEYGAGMGQPDVFDSALAQRIDELEDVKIRACLTLRPRAVLEADPGRDHFHWFNWHYTGYDRAKGDVGCANYIPCNLGEIPDYYRRFIDPSEIAVIKTCPKDKHGFYNFSLATLWERAIVERAKLVVVEESAGLPYLDGSRTRCTRARSTT
jgi:acyl-CoA hydrolase